MLQDQQHPDIGLPTAVKSIIISLLQLALTFYYAAIRNFSLTHQHADRQLYQQKYHYFLPIVQYLSTTDDMFFVDVDQDKQQIIFQCGEIFITRAPG